jgi:hypothetical protein
MRKQLFGTVPSPVEFNGPKIDLESIAGVRLTSEDPAYPIESALADDGKGWKAAAPGEQSISFDFDPPHHIERILVCFETAETRTQEFELSCTLESGIERQVVRQQFNFSPSTRRQLEDYRVNLPGVTELKITIKPDISGGDARATLRTLTVR